MGQRLDFQTILEEVLGSESVYFQPPNNITMVYPCIVYQRDNAVTLFADDVPYRYEQRYQVTLIDRNPDSAVFMGLVALPRSIFNRHYVVDNLNHDVFNIYF